MQTVIKRWEFVYGLVIGSLFQSLFCDGGVYTGIALAALIAAYAAILVKPQRFFFAREEEEEQF